MTVHSWWVYGPVPYCLDRLVSTFPFPQDGDSFKTDSVYHMITYSWVSNISVPKALKYDEFLSKNKQTKIFIFTYKY